MISIINFKFLISLLHCEDDPWVKALAYHAPHFILFCSLAITTPPACLSPSHSIGIKARENMAYSVPECFHMNF